jgi:glycosyltransferase involved in cell wall biosynthesis
VKILLLHNRYQQRGGEDASVGALQQLLIARGHEVRFIEADNVEIDGSAAAAKAAASWVYSRKWKARVAAEIASFGPDVAHVHNVFPLLSPSVIHACNAFRVPVVQTLHNYRLMCPIGILFRSGKVCESCVTTSFPWAGVFHRCYHGSALGTAVVGAGSTIHRLLATYSRNVDCFIALTEFAKAKFVTANLPEAKIEVIPNWLARDPSAGNGKGGFFLFVGRLSPEKGLATLLAAWPKVAFPAKLKIVGTGPLEADVMAAAANQTGIEYLGYLPGCDVLQLMKDATALIVPSECYEGLPMTVVEAYASGTPVIASRLGSLKELVSDERTGMLFPPQDSDALARAIDWVIRNPDQLPLMRIGARSAYEANYTADCGYRLIMRVYKRVIGESKDATQLSGRVSWNQ